MSAFCDASAIVLLYSDEPGAEAVRLLEGMAIAETARVQVTAELWRRHALGLAPAQACRVLVQTFEHDLTRADGPFAPIRVSGQLLHEASVLAGIHSLSATAAIDLAAARAARRAAPDCDTIYTRDASLAAAAQREGFAHRG